MSSRGTKLLFAVVEPNLWSPVEELQGEWQSGRIYECKKTLTIHIKLCFCFLPRMFGGLVCCVAPDGHCQFFRPSVIDRKAVLLCL